MTKPKVRTNRDQHSAPEQNRNIADKMDVHRETEVDLHPEIEKENTANEQKKNSRETLKMLMEGLTLLAVIVYTVVSGCQLNTLI
jgi:hypothetical protein